MKRELARTFNDFLESSFVLVIEPALNYRTSIKQFLSNLKVKHLKQVSSISEARREMLTMKVGFIICEWQIPEKNGLQFCRELRRELAYRQTPFLLTSTENLKSDVMLASEVGITGYLLKPFSFEDFCNQIDSLIRPRTAPTNLASRLEQAEQILALGDPAAAEPLFQDTLAVTPNSARAMLGLAKIRKEQGKFDEAIAVLHKAIATNADYVDAYRLLLTIHEERNDNHSIIMVATMLNNISPDNPRYHLVLAKAQMEVHNYGESEKYFRNAIRMSPKLVDCYKGLGELYMQIEEYEKAKKNFMKALDLDEGDVSTLNSLGLAHVRVGKIKEGINRYMLALRIDPTDPRVLFNIGHAYETLKEFDRARLYYAKALSNDPHFDKAKRGLQRVGTNAGTPPPPPKKAS